MQAQAAEKTEVVVVYRTMFVLCQPDDSLVIFHVVGKDDADTAYWVILDPVHEERGIRHHLTDPVGVGALRHRPLQDVWLVDSFQESVEVAPVRYQ